MNFEHIKVEPEYSLNNEENEHTGCENGDNHREYSQEIIKTKTENVKSENIECLLAEDVPYESQDGVNNTYECDNDGLLQLVSIEPYCDGTNIQHTTCDDNGTSAAYSDTSQNEIYDIDSDSFQIIYIDGNNTQQTFKNHMLEDLSENEDITIISCDQDEVPDSNIEDISNNNKKEKGRSVPNITWFKCNICQFKTSKQTKYEKHVKEHIGIGKMTMYTCQKCDFKTIYSGNLKKHILRHENIKSFCCDLCSYKANLKERLHDHMTNVHLKNYSEKHRLYQCPNCEYSTEKVSNYKRHTKSSHKNMFECKLCDFKTIFKHKFVEHSICHDKVEDTSLEQLENVIFQCEICGYETTKLEILSQHNRKRHPREVHRKNITEHKKNGLNQQFKMIKAHNVTVYKCEECGHSTTDASNFNRHLKSHRKNCAVSLFECYTCGLKTKYKINLVKHFNKHRTEGKMRR